MTKKTKAKPKADKWKVLACDGIAEAGLEILKQAPAVKVVISPPLSEDDLIKAIADCHALLVRSQTKVTAKAIAAAKKLKIIARAGVGVDNVDVEAATKHGVIVCNSPSGNTMAAAEHTWA